MARFVAPAAALLGALSTALGCSSAPPQASPRGRAAPAPPAASLATVTSATPAGRPSASAATPTAAPAPGAAGVRAWTAWHADRSLPGDERVRLAFAARSDVVKGLFASAGVSFPPATLFFRAYKREELLEVWAASELGSKLSRVATYAICALSGALGPKRREGDGQVPEGFYVLNYFWPNSAYHLEMKIGYPNALEQRISEKEPGGPGGNIMIHGSCASIGCLAMGDERIEELWVMATTYQTGDKKVAVHIFPSRDFDGLLRDPGYQDLWSFWSNLADGHERFERTRRVPRVTTDWHGKYIFP